MRPLVQASSLALRGLGLPLVHSIEAYNKPDRSGNNHDNAYAHQDASQRGDELIKGDWGHGGFLYRKNLASSTMMNYASVSTSPFRTANVAVLFGAFFTPTSALAIIGPPQLQLQSPLIQKIRAWMRSFQTNKDDDFGGHPTLTRGAPSRIARELNFRNNNV